MKLVNSLKCEYHTCDCSTFTVTENEVIILQCQLCKCSGVRFSTPTEQYNILNHNNNACYSFRSFLIKCYINLLHLITIYLLAHEHRFVDNLKGHFVLRCPHI